MSVPEKKVHLRIHAPNASWTLVVYRSIANRAIWAFEEGESRITIETAYAAWGGSDATKQWVFNGDLIVLMELEENEPAF